MSPFSAAEDGDAMPEPCAVDPVSIVWFGLWLGLWLSLPYMKLLLFPGPPTREIGRELSVKLLLAKPPFK